MGQKIAAMLVAIVATIVALITGYLVGYDKDVFVPVSFIIGLLVFVQLED